MTDFSYQYIPYNRELFVFLSGEQMSIPHGHGDILVAHELLQSHERDFAGLRQPGGEGMSHGVRVTAYRLSPSSGARLSFLTAVWKQTGVFQTPSSCGAVGRWVPQACAYTPGASGSYPPARGRIPALLPSE